jgi:hypothetical protein
LNYEEEADACAEIGGEAVETSEDIDSRLGKKEDGCKYWKYALAD